ncbi:hypothetical protein FB451DRAFT_1183320 [Mycena latifolia]|nr:hypothetical protein FB451DRAFT_1183320 [Mycena latifolia]
MWAGKGVREERPQGTFGEGGDPVRASFPWCHGALVRVYGQRGRSFGPHEQSCGALRIVESSNGLVGRCPFLASRKPNLDIPSSQSRVVSHPHNAVGVQQTTWYHSEFLRMERLMGVAEED